MGYCDAVATDRSDDGNPVLGIDARVLGAYPVAGSIAARINVIGRKPATVFDVGANKEWQNTWLYIASGETVIISYVLSEWSEHTKFYGPNGNPDYPLRWQANVLQDCLRGALIARAGGMQYRVQSKFTHKMAAPGYLYLRMNDNIAGELSHRP